jgi:hypothetical protein
VRRLEHCLQAAAFIRYFSGMLRNITNTSVCLIKAFAVEYLGIAERVNNPDKYWLNY